ncbi:MAG: Short-chain dehydrogenase/reductase SDR?, partial [uncultured Corynebacteriales bacterium]
AGEPVHPAGPQRAARPAGRHRRAARPPGPDRRDGRAARPRRADLPRQRPAGGQAGGRDRRRLRHRPGRRAGVRPGGGRRPDLLPGVGGEGRPGDRTADRGRRPEGGHRARGPHRRAGLPAGDRPRGRRAGRHRHPGEQRRLPDGAARRHRRHHHRAVRPGAQDQPVRDVLAVQEGAAAPAGRRQHHQHLLHPVLPALPGAAGLRHHEGRHRQLHQGPGPAAGRARDPGELRRPRPGLDAADPGDHAGREHRGLRLGHPAGPRRAAGRARPGVRVLRLPGVQLRHRGGARRHRRPAPV